MTGVTFRESDHVEHLYDVPGVLVVTGVHAGHVPADSPEATAEVRLCQDIAPSGWVWMPNRATIQVIDRNGRPMWIGARWVCHRKASCGQTTCRVVLGAYTKEIPDLLDVPGAMIFALWREKDLPDLCLHISEIPDKFVEKDAG